VSEDADSSSGNYENDSSNSNDETDSGSDDDTESGSDEEPSESDANSQSENDDGPKHRKIPAKKTSRSGKSVPSFKYFSNDLKNHLSVSKIKNTKKGSEAAKSQSPC
jgi:hypothetical protein